MGHLPQTGFLRLPDIIGDRAKGIPALIPVIRSTWWARVALGLYPKGIKLGPRTTAWRVEQIKELIANPGAETR
jgi:prophage regulatory protein